MLGSTGPASPTTSNRPSPAHRPSHPSPKDALPSFYSFPLSHHPKAPMRGRQHSSGGRRLLQKCSNRWPQELGRGLRSNRSGLTGEARCGWQGDCCGCCTDRSSRAGHELQDRPAADDAPEAPRLAAGKELACPLRIPVSCVRDRERTRCGRLGVRGSS